MPNRQRHDPARRARLVAVASGWLATLGPNSRGSWRGGVRLLPGHMAGRASPPCGSTRNDRCRVLDACRRREARLKRGRVRCPRPCSREPGLDPVACRARWWRCSLPSRSIPRSRRSSVAGGPRTRRCRTCECTLDRRLLASSELSGPRRNARVGSSPGHLLRCGLTSRIVAFAVDRFGTVRPKHGSRAEGPPRADL